MSIINTQTLACDSLSWCCSRWKYVYFLFEFVACEREGGQPREILLTSFTSSGATMYHRLTVQSAPIIRTHSYGKISKVTHKPKISVCSSSYWLGLMPNGDQTTIFTSQMWKWRAKRSVAMLYVRHAKWDRERNAKKERNEIGVKWIALRDKYHSLQIIIIIIIPKASCAQSAHARECSIAQILNKYTRGPSRRPPSIAPCFSRDWLWLCRWLAKTVQEPFKIKHGQPINATVWAVSCVCVCMCVCWLRFQFSSILISKCSVVYQREQASERRRNERASIKCCSGTACLYM